MIDYIISCKFPCFDEKSKPTLVESFLTYNGLQGEFELSFDKDKADVFVCEKDAYDTLYDFLDNLPNSYIRQPKNVIEDIKKSAKIYKMQ